MTIRIGNAPCSWGVEFADDTRNPHWSRVLDECARAGFKGIELGPVGYMPEDPFVLADALALHDLKLIGGVVYQPFYDASRYDDIRDTTIRTCTTLLAHGAEHLVLIDSISPRRAQTAGRPLEAEQLSNEEWRNFTGRIEAIANMATQEFGLIVSIHPHAGGFIDFRPEVERLLDDTDPAILKLCIDTGHCQYAGYDPIEFMQCHGDRLSYVHFKDINESVRCRVVQNRTGFYEACAQGIFCRLGQGSTEFVAVRQVLLDIDYRGWCTVEQDCDPAGSTSPLDDAIANRIHLESIGFI